MTNCSRMTMSPIKLNFKFNFLLGCFLLLAYFSVHSFANSSQDTIQIINQQQIADQAALQIKHSTNGKRVILFVWDGLRRDVITQQNTPNLYKLKQNGVYFSDHHSSYPTVTMNNANSLATGNYSGATGFYGNRVWRPDITTELHPDYDFRQPVFVQEHFILKNLSQANNGKPLMYVDTLMEVARAHGLTTAQVGKAGPAALQDGYKLSKKGIVLTADKIYPLEFAKKIHKKGYLIPSDAAKFYADPKMGAKEDKDPTQKLEPVQLKSLDGSIPLVKITNPQEASDALARQANEYFMDVYLKEILPDYKPDFSVLWFRDPDTSAHKYGPGSVPFYQALANQDKLLGKLLVYLDKLGLNKSTNLLIVSDHGHSNVSADTNIFPLREIKNNSIGDVSPVGYSVSGNIRIADMMTKVGFHAYDGRGCDYNPVLHGMLADRKLLMPIKADQSGDICGDGPGRLYTTSRYVVPKELPDDAVIIANNGGSAYLYVPSQDPELVTLVVRFLQSRPEFDSIFVDSKYGEVPGTLPLRKVKFYDDIQGRHSDILVSMSYNESQVVRGLSGTIISSSKTTRGSHGTLSPVDIQNTFIAFGPDFKSKYTDVLPTANVDVPVSIAYLLNLPFEGRAGRQVLEAIKGTGVEASKYELRYRQLQPKQPATKLKIHSLLSTGDNEIFEDKNNYTFVLNTKQLYLGDNVYNYIDSGKGIRY